MPRNTPPHDHSNYYATTSVADPGLFGNGDDMDVEMPDAASTTPSRKRLREEPLDEDIRIQKKVKKDVEDCESYMAIIADLDRSDLLEECKFLFECLADMRLRNDPDWTPGYSDAEESFSFEY